MEVELPACENPAMTFDEVSLEHSKSFVKALQELKNLRPQLYSAAEYCEKSYLHSEQKEMVLDNLKEYAVQALVNAVDHLGTVAYKLTDLLQQQTLEVSTMELKASCLNQQLLTCRTYTSKQGRKQHQLLAFIPRHHKHYILPNSVNKKVHFSPHVQADYRQNYSHASPLQPSAMESQNLWVMLVKFSSYWIMDMIRGQSLCRHLFLLRKHLFRHRVSCTGNRKDPNR